ncbi:MAG: glycoside hydrolase family 3 N-terminal domain-containing protein, partial [Candidatus Krumholzibacteriia bacterium]
MSDRDDLAARLVVGLAGPGLHPAEVAWLVRHRPAGVILFGRNVTGADQLAALAAALRVAVPGLEIGADHEGGPVAVLAAAVGRPPAAATLGLLDDPDLTRRVHAATGRRLAACGIDRVFAPVADVLTEPRNPVIGVRAFGADCDLVARHVAAAVVGLTDGGVACCLKHWPGHGGTVADSHLEAAVLGAPPPEAPFAAGLAAGAGAAMVAHVLPPGGGGLPASLDPAQAAALRALAPDRTLVLYADDVTMGALRAPLAAAGVAGPAAAGLADPAD